VRKARYRNDGRLEIDNNAAERAIRGIAMQRSLCPPSSSIWEHWKLVFQIDATRAICSPDRGDDPLVLEVGGTDLVRGAGHNLVGSEDSVLDEPADAMVRDTERGCVRRGKQGERHASIWMRKCRRMRDGGRA
jgi:hypothetical protein